MKLKRIDSNVSIRIGTVGITPNTHKVLTVKAQTAKLLQQHITRRVPCCPADWLPYAMRIPVRGQLIEGQNLTETAHGPGSKREVSYVFFVNQRITVSSSVLFFIFANSVFLEYGFCDYERYVIQKKTVLDINAVERVYVE